MSVDLNQTSSGGSFILRQSRYATDLNSQLEILPSPHVVTEIRVEIGCLNLSHIPHLDFSILVCTQVCY